MSILTMGNKRFCSIAIASILFLLTIYSLSLNGFSRHRLLELSGVSVFEEEVRQGNVLPAPLLKNACESKDIHFLTIGGRVAYGKNLQKEQTYTHLLCDGDRIAGSDLEADDVAPCIQKMLGGNYYHVIVIDLHDNPNENLIKLTSKLARRFPKARMINLRHFFPGDVGFQHRNGWVSVATWARAQGYDSMTKEALEAFKNADRPWTVKYDKTRASYYERNSNENDMWSLFKDPNESFEIVGDYWKEILLRRAWMYSDWFELNEIGHKDIARGIFDMATFKRTETFNSFEINPWDEEEDESMC